MLSVLREKALKIAINHNKYLLIADKSDHCMFIIRKTRGLKNLTSLSHKIWFSCMKKITQELKVLPHHQTTVKDFIYLRTNPWMIFSYKNPDQVQ